MRSTQANADNGDSVSTTTAIASLGRGLAVLAILAVATGCASKAREYGGRWKPVNRYGETPQEIPLYQAYVFYPSPMDGTLKAMLERWARDSKMTLSYLHASDFTLHAAVAEINTNDLQQAVSQLSMAYAAQGVSVATEGNQIVVRSAAPATASATPESTTAATP